MTICLGNSFLLWQLFFICHSHCHFSLLAASLERSFVIGQVPYAGAICRSRKQCHSPCQWEFLWPKGVCVCNPFHVCFSLACWAWLRSWQRSLFFILPPQWTACFLLTWLTCAVSHSVPPFLLPVYLLPFFSESRCWVCGWISCLSGEQGSAARGRTFSSVWPSLQLGNSVLHFVVGSYRCLLGSPGMEFAFLCMFSL